MDSKRKRTGGTLAVLAATVVACGSIQGAAGQADPARGGGTIYLTDGEGYGTGLLRPEINPNYPPQEQDVPEFLLTQPGVTRMSGASPMSGDTSGAMLQP